MAYDADGVFPAIRISARQFALSADGSRMARMLDGGPDLEMADAAPGKKWKRAWVEGFAPETVGPIAIMPDGRVVFAFNDGWTDGNRMELHAFGPDGDTLPFPSANRPIVTDYQQLDQILPHPSRNLFVARAGMAFVVYDFGPPTLLQKHKITNDNRKHFTGLAIHPSGNVLAAAANDHTVKLYDANTWTPRGTFEWKSGRMRSVAYNRDGTLCAAGTDRGQVVVWDVD